MTEAEIEQLVSLVNQLKREGLGTPNMPYRLFTALQGVVVQAAAELVVTRSGRDFLLTERRDEHWNGWHLPGGFLGPGESLEEACRRIGERELRVSVEFKRLITVFVWPDHPYASAVSLVCLCTSRQAPATGSFFSEIPDGIIAQHAACLKAFLRQQSVELTHLQGEAG